MTIEGVSEPVHARVIDRASPTRETRRIWSHAPQYSGTWLRAKSVAEITMAVLAPTVFSRIAKINPLKISSSIKGASVIANVAMVKAAPGDENNSCRGKVSLSGNIGGKKITSNAKPKPVIKESRTESRLGGVNRKLAQKGWP